MRTPPREGRDLLHAYSSRLGTASIALAAVVASACAAGPPAVSEQPTTAAGQPSVSEGTSLSTATATATSACEAGTTPAARRIAGTDRIATAVALADAGWSGSGASTVVLAAARDFPDALAATPWAAAHTAPLLLTEQDHLPATVAQALRRLGTREVVIVGGTAAVSDAVEDEVTSIVDSVRRLAGTDRFGTAVAIAEDLHEEAAEVIVVTSHAFADAVAAGPLATAGTRPPILLTRPGALPSATIDALESLTTTHATVVGGPAAVADQVLEELQDAGVEAVRVAGRDRYATSAAVVAEAATRHGAHDAVSVVTGADFPDALAANAYAAEVATTVLLVDRDDLIDHTATLDTLGANGSAWPCAVVVGGEDAIDARVAEQVVAGTGAWPPDGDPVLLGAGDIASCGLRSDEATAALLDGLDGTVLTLGDNAYDDGTAQQYRDCYLPTWGRHLVRTRASLGNHDIRTADGGPTYDIFGIRVGTRGEGWHAIDLGPGWRVLVLNSNCPGTVRCDADSPQYAWLRDQLEAAGERHVIVAAHHPRWSSGVYAPGEARVDGLWRLAADGGADLWLAGHEHAYERFEPKDADGTAAPGGLQQLTAGTGGASLRPVGEPQPGSEARVVAHGVLELTLHPDGYTWRFLDVDGEVRDHGERTLPR